MQHVGILCVDAGSSCALYGIPAPPAACTVPPAKAGRAPAPSSYSTPQTTSFFEGALHACSNGGSLMKGGTPYRCPLTLRAVKFMCARQGSSLSDQTAQGAAASRGVPAFRWLAGPQADIVLAALQASALSCPAGVRVSRQPTLVGRNQGQACCCLLDAAWDLQGSRGRGMRASGHTWTWPPAARHSTWHATSGHPPRAALTGGHRRGSGGSARSRRGTRRERSSCEGGRVDQGAQG